MVVTNHDDSIQPTASIEYSPQSYFPEYQNESFKPSSLSHYAENHLPTQSIKAKTMNKGIWLAAAALGGLYLSNRWEQATAEKAKLKMIEKLKIAAAHSSASNTTNTLLSWFLGLGGTGLATGVGLKAVELSQSSEARKLAKAANGKLDEIKGSLGSINGATRDTNTAIGQLDERLIGTEAKPGMLRGIRENTFDTAEYIFQAGRNGNITEDPIYPDHYSN
jgi:hypothetical protein